MESTKLYYGLMYRAAKHKQNNSLVPLDIVHLFFVQQSLHFKIYFILPSYFLRKVLYSTESGMNDRRNKHTVLETCT
jgi:hypothetical protein